MLKSKIVGCDLLRWHNACCEKAKSHDENVEILRNMAILAGVFALAVIVKSLLP